MNDKQHIIAEFIAAVRRDGSAPAALQQELAELLARGRGRPADLNRLADLEMAMIVREFENLDNPADRGPTVDQIIRGFVGDDPDEKKFEALRKAWYNKALQTKLKEAIDTDRIYDVAQCYDAARRAARQYFEHFGMHCPPLDTLNCEFWEMAGTILARIESNKPF